MGDVVEGRFDSVPVGLSREEWVQLKNWFTYHAPKKDQPEKYERIRKAALEFALILAQNCPPCEDTAAAIRKLRETVMAANLAIACNE